MKDRNHQYQFPTGQAPEMWSWSSLDGQTRAWYVPYIGIAGQGWVSDAASPGLFFGVAQFHKDEAEAARRVAAFYAEFLRKREEKHV